MCTFVLDPTTTISSFREGQSLNATLAEVNYNIFVSVLPLSAPYIHTHHILTSPSCPCNISINTTFYSTTSAVKDFTGSHLQVRNVGKFQPPESLLFLLDLLLDFEFSAGSPSESLRTGGLSDLTLFPR